MDKEKTKRLLRWAQDTISFVYVIPELGEESEKVTELQSIAINTDARRIADELWKEAREEMLEKHGPKRSASSFVSAFVMKVFNWVDRNHFKRVE